MQVQHLDVFSGENRTLLLTARDPSNVAVNLAGKTISWVVGRRPNDPANPDAIFTKTGTPTVTTSGIFSVSVTPADTDALEGDYRHQATTLDSSGNYQVVTVGRFRIRPDITQ